MAIPSLMRLEVLDNNHEGHQDIPFTEKVSMDEKFTEVVRALRSIMARHSRSGSRPGLKVSKTRSDNFRSRPPFLKCM